MDRLTGLGPPVPRCAVVGRGPVLPIVDGLEGSGTARYAELPVVHSERKFQSHPAVPPARLIGHLFQVEWNVIRWSFDFVNVILMVKFGVQF